jgi:hypothetical protein
VRLIDVDGELPWQVLWAWRAGEEVCAVTADDIDNVPTVSCAECEYGPPPADAVGAPTACLHCFCGDNFERRQP